MKRLESVLLSCCAYTVAITVAFFTLAAAFGQEVYLSFYNFFICILVGGIIATSSLIFKIKSLAGWIKLPIHFFVLMIAYIPFLYVSIPEFMQRQASIFIAVMLFIIFYAIGFAISIGIKKLLKIK
jgi:hypothetical protein